MKTQEWATSAELRALLKQNLKLNARQVTVKGSGRYLTMTIRDASVSIESVRQFAKIFHTWHMDSINHLATNLGVLTKP